MIRFIVKRILWMIPTVLGVLLIIFTINELMPGDPASAALGTNYTEELYQQKREEMGLNRPFLTRYADYVVGFFTEFDLGTSYSSLRPVKTLILERIWVSIKLGLLGSVITIVFGVLIGVISAVKQYSVLDYIITVLATFFASMPGFWLALMGIIIFAQELNWLPAAGRRPGSTISCRSFALALRHHAGCAHDPDQHAGCDPSGLYPARLGPRASRSAP